MSTCETQPVESVDPRSPSRLLEEQRLKLALAALNGGTWDWNIETADVAYSDGWWRMLGYEPAALQPTTYSTWENLLHPEDRSAVVQRLRDLVEGVSDTYHSEHRLRHQSGRWVWVLDRGHIAGRNKDLRANRAIGTEVDITELKRTEEILRDSEERYRLLVENMPDAVFVHHDGIVAYANPAMLDLIGASSAGEILGRNILSHIPCEYQEIIQQRIARLKETGEPNPSIELKYIRLDGTEIHVDARATPCVYAGRSGIQVIMRDTTQHHLAKEELQKAHDELELRVRQRTAQLESVNQSLRDEIAERKRAEKKIRLFQTAFEHARDAVAILDAPLQSRSAVVLYVNPAFTRMTGYVPGEILGQTLEGQAYFENLVTKLGVCDEFLGEAQGRRKDGSVFPLEWSASPVLDEWGQTTEYVTIQRDVSARKAAEEQVRRHHEELAHVLRQVTLGEMGTALAHELNQPLAAITSFTRGALLRLEAGHPAGEEMIAALHQVVGQAGRAAAIIKRVRGILRKSDAEFTEIHIPGLIRNILQLFEIDLQKLEIEVRFESSPGLPPVFGDSIQVEQVLLNILRNALNALSEISTPRLLSIQACPCEADSVQVDIADNGPGIKADCREKVFDAFYTTRPDGLGMGLSISRSIIESHGGRLWCSAAPESGASFHFTLPVHLRRE